MKVGITVKMFMACLAVGVLTVVAMTIGSRISFSNGFLGYLNSQAVARAEALVPEMAEAYRLNGSWAFLRDNESAWLRMLGYSVSDVADSGVDPLILESNTRLRTVNLRLALRDANGERVAGNEEVGPNSPSWPIVVDGVTVGSLVLMSMEEVRGRSNIQFEDQQLRAAWLIAGGSVALAGALAIWLSYAFLRGLRQVSHSVHHLAVGDYSVRAPRLANDEVGKLADDCNILAEILESIEKRRRQFMADISHELRTPLTVLSAELEQMKDGVLQPTPETIKSLRAEAATLGKLIDDLHSLSIAESGAQAYRFEPIDLLECLNLVLAAFHERFAEQRIEVKKGQLDGHVVVHADSSRIWQVFANICENVLRHAGGDSRLQVQVDFGGDTAVITFDDSGPGVPADQLPKLFERFYRVDRSRSRKLGGTGLGLAICKSIIEVHQGTISASRSPLGGLRLVVVLPIVRPPGG